MADLFSADALQAARVGCLDEQELDFAAPDGHAMISYRNEAAALSLILHRLKTTEGKSTVAELHYATIRRGTWSASFHALMAGVADSEVQSFVEAHIMPMHQFLPAAEATGRSCTSEADTELLRQACNSKTGRRYFSVCIACREQDMQ